MAIMWLLTLTSAAPTPHSSSVPLYGQYEITLTGPSEAAVANPFEVELSATFTHTEPPTGTPIVVGGFYDGGGTYRVRFSPPAEGEWKYTTASSASALDGSSGEFHVVKKAAGDRGPVVSKGSGLYYADFTPHVSVGTTCYQWASKGFDMQAQTLETLKASPFNKIRMTTFPKWYIFNRANPVETGAPYEIAPGSAAANASAWACVGEHCPSLSGSFDLKRFNVSFWQNYDRLVGALKAQGVIADIILFHPYDGGHWGFDCMGGTDAQKYDTTLDKFYLRYAVARLASYSNVWWSMANEWSFNKCKGRGVNESAKSPDPSPSPVWDELFETLAAADPYGRQASIHNGNLLYNHSRPWISHVSLQGMEDTTPAIRTKYGKPTIWDEVRYEGNITSSWGALSAAEEADRFWWGAALGVHVGHSETVLRAAVKDDDAQPLWWAKGGTLVGESPSRIAFFKQLWASTGADFGALTPAQASYGQAGDPVSDTLTGDSVQLVKFRRQGTWNVPLPGGGDGGAWKAVSVDYWGMTTTELPLPTSGATVAVDVNTLPFTLLFTKSAAAAA